MLSCTNSLYCRNNTEMNEKQIRAISVETFQKVKSNFRQKKLEYATKNIVTRMLMKKELNEVGFKPIFLPIR